MARFYEQSGQAAQAERVYQQALRLWPKHVGTVLNYARFKDRQGSPQDALRLYQDAVRDFPKEAAVHNDLGLFYARAGKNQEALRAFSQAIQLQPKRPLYRNNMAALLVDMGQPDEAMTQLKTVCGEAEACYKLGYLMQKKGDSPEAQRLFAKALLINPGMADARTWLQYLQTNRNAPVQVAQRATPNVSVPPADVHPQPQPLLLRRRCRRGNRRRRPRRCRRSRSPAMSTQNPRSAPGRVRRAYRTQRNAGRCVRFRRRWRPLPRVEEDEAGPAARARPASARCPRRALPPDSTALRRLPPMR